jgi:hypothetical protein
VARPKRFRRLGARSSRALEIVKLTPQGHAAFFAAVHPLHSDVRRICSEDMLGWWRRLEVHFLHSTLNSESASPGPDREV